MYVSALIGDNGAQKSVSDSWTMVEVMGWMSSFQEDILVREE